MNKSVMIIDPTLHEKAHHFTANRLNRIAPSSLVGFEGQAMTLISQLLDAHAKDQAEIEKLRNLLLIVSGIKR